MGALDAQFPFPPKIPLGPALRVDRDDRHEERALLDLPADLRVPRVAAMQLALIEPDLQTERPERIGNAARRVRVVPGIAEKNSAWRIRWHAGQRGQS